MKAHPKIFLWLAILLISISFLLPLASALDSPTAKTKYILSAFSKNDYYAVKSTIDNNILYFDSGKNAVPWTFNVGQTIGSLAISPDGNYVAVGCSGGTIFFFDREGSLLWKKTFGASTIKTISFSRDSLYIDASNPLNQAFYINVNGDLATRIVEQITSTVPIQTITVDPTAEPNKPAVLPTSADLSKTLWLLVVVGSIGSYFLYAVFSWGARRELLAISMVTIPLMAYFFSTSTIPGTINSLLYIFIIFVGCIILAGLLLTFSDKIRRIIEKYILKSQGKSRHFFLPNLTYSLIGIVVISVLMITLGNFAILNENANTALKSTPVVATGSQTLLPVSTPNPPIYSTVMVTQTPSFDIFNPLPTQNLDTGPSPRNYPYVLRGTRSTLGITLFSGAFEEISSKSTPPACTRYNSDSSPCTPEEIRQYYLKFIDDPDQKKYLDDLVDSIKSKTSNNDDQARIAISLVQQIPYDYSRLNTQFKVRRPYEVLYENKGVCSEKSVLLAYLLRELGYGVVLLEFPAQNHMAVGIKSPSQYDFRNSGYAFVETASPTILTDDQGDYVGAGKLTSTPDVLSVSEGTSFNTISEEFRDANRFNQLQALSKISGGVLDQNSYYEWMTLAQKYGLQTS